MIPRQGLVVSHLGFVGSLPTRSEPALRSRCHRVALQNPRHDKALGVATLLRTLKQTYFQGCSGGCLIAFLRQLMMCSKGRDRGPRRYFQPIRTFLTYGKQSARTAGQGPHYQCCRFESFGTEHEVVVIRWLTATMAIPLLRTLLLTGISFVPW